MDVAGSPPTKSELLTEYLNNWWRHQVQYHMYSPWPPVAITHDEQVQAIAGEFAQDLEQAQIKLCGFLGTPEGKVIAAATETAIPQPYRLLVQEALALICQRQGADRQRLIGAVTIIAALMLIVLATTRVK